MSIREVIKRRRRILVAVTVCAFLVLFLGVRLSVTLHRPWLAYLGAFILFAAAYLNNIWLKCPRCHRSIGFARQVPHKSLPLFAPGESCPYCGVSLDEPWDKKS
jgi:uncharacterized membrane protein YfcA